MLSDFKKFILRGNVVDLAVAVVIGAAFNSIIQSLVKDLITPLIAAIGGKPNFSNLFFTVHHSKFMYGDFINAVVSFLILALVVFFLVVQPINKLIALSNRSQKPTEPGTKKCPECLSDVPSKATRCAFCTVKLK
ncbi:MAG TPA: large conductance mechanosensitive channel protein MscL [Candidatus Saccharimonadales bacterium]|nr:large conductance mechanosensitive channel protein MscL [Candidatus Saccharimonadales bacterium]